MNRKIKCFIFICFVFIISFSTMCFAQTDAKTRKAAHYGNVRVKGHSDYACWALKGTHGKKINLSEYGEDAALNYFHGMFYVAKVRKNYTANACDDKGGTVSVKKGQEILIIYFTKKGNCVARLKNKRAIYIPASKITVTQFVYNSSDTYTDAQVEEWVKLMGITSSTNYMFVASKYNQHAWILTRQNGEWICKYKMKITTSSRRNSTGKYPNDHYGLNKCSINTHYVHKKGMGKGISYHSKEGGNQIHVRGNSLYPSTHGCIAMSRKDYNFIYYYLPYKTRVVLF